MLFVHEMMKFKLKGSYTCREAKNRYEYTDALKGHEWYNLSSKASTRHDSSRLPYESEDSKSVFTLRAVHHYR